MILCPIKKISAITFSTMKAPYIKFREVHRRFVFDYPFRQGLSRTAGRLMPIELKPAAI